MLDGERRLGRVGSRFIVSSLLSRREIDSENKGEEK